MLLAVLSPETVRRSGAHLHGQVGSSALVLGEEAGARLFLPIRSGRELQSWLNLKRDQR